MSRVHLIAIVDDDAAVREALRDLLEAIGFSARTYADAAALLGDYAPGRFDLVVTDLRMPRMSGIELLRRLRAMDGAPPAIVVTSSSDPATRALAVEEGALACLAKPIAEAELLRLIGSALDRNDHGRCGH